MPRFPSPSEVCADRQVGRRGPLCLCQSAADNVFGPERGSIILPVTNRMACSEESFLELGATAFKDTHHHILSSKPSEMEMPGAHCDFSLPFFWLLPLWLLSAHFSCFCFHHVLI